MSELLEEMLNSDSSKVSVGRDVIANKFIKVSGSVTEVNLQQVEKFGSEGEQAYANERRLAYRTRQNSNDSSVEEVSFDSTTGRLVFVRRNGEVFYVEELPTLDKFGRGPSGNRGFPGEDGFDGEDGVDGEDGEIGCPGVTGPTGIQGETGPTGAMGETGPTGPMGAMGSQGNMGPVGHIGKNGFEGSRGATGPSCNVLGAPGAPGPNFGETGYGSSALNNSAVAFVILNDDGVHAITPAGGWNNNVSNSTIDDSVEVDDSPDEGEVDNPPASPTGEGTVWDVDEPASIPATVDVQLQPVIGILNSCKPTSAEWGDVYASYVDEPTGYIGLGIIPSTNWAYDKANVDNSIVLMALLPAGARYAFDFITPKYVSGTLYLNCQPLASTSASDRTRKLKTVTLLEDTVVTLKFRTSKDRSPTWAALRIMTEDGVVLYTTGDGKALREGEFADQKSSFYYDVNWRSNSEVNYTQ